MLNLLTPQYATLPLAQQLIETAHSIALKEGITNRETIKFYTSSILLSNKYQENGITHKQNEQVKILKQLRDQISKLSPEVQLGISRLLAIDSVIINAVDHFMKDKTQPSIKDQMKEMLLNGIRTDTPAEFIETTRETIQEKMTIILKHTVHPVIFSSEESRKSEALLSQTLQRLAKGKGNKELAPRAINAIERGNGLLGAPTVLIEEVETDVIEDSSMVGIIRAIRGGTTLSPFDKVTIAEEATIEEINIECISEQIPTVLNAWNEVIKELLEGNDIPKEQHKKFTELEISEERSKEIFTIGTWLRGGDKDGRAKETSISQFDGIEKDITNNLYAGPQVDLRQNSGILRDTIGAFIQKKIRGGDIEFHEFCADFLGEHSTPRKSLYQNLSSDDRTELLKQMMEEGYNVVPEAIKDNTVAFNQYFRDFVKAHNFGETTTFQELPIAKQVELRQKLENEGFYLSDDGLSYGLDSNYRETVTYLNKSQKINPDKTDENDLPPYVEMSDGEKSIAMDLPKTLAVANHHIEEYGTNVTQQHIIANFEKTDDFYGLLKMMQETKLVNLARNRDDRLTVTDAKMDISPLLETLDDMQNAKEVFTKILDDPLALSYYKARGSEAHFTFGFSDGSKDAGDFASQLAIKNTLEELTELFADKDIQLIPLQGRGRGTNRGGTLDEPGLAMNLVPENVALNAVFHQTIQGDLPVNMATSTTTAERNLASMFIGTVAARQNAVDGLSRTEEEETSREEAEAIMRGIAFLAGKTFQEEVKNNPQALDFVSVYQSDPDISSRAQSRGAGKPSWGDNRAIKVEYAAAITKLGFHNIGLKEALNAFGTGGVPQVNRQGKLVDAKGNLLEKGDKPILIESFTKSDGVVAEGKAALNAIYNENSFFRTFIDLNKANAAQHDPVIAMEYGKIKTTNGNTQEFVSTVNKSLDGLSDLLERISSDKVQGKHSAIKTDDSTTYKPPHNTIALVAQAFNLNNGGKIPSKEMNENAAKIAKNVGAVLSAAHTGISVHKRQVSQSQERSI